MTRQKKEKLKSPWTLGEDERWETPNFLRVEKTAQVARGIFSESAGYTSVFSRYLRRKSAEHGIEIKDQSTYVQCTYALFDFLTDAGYLARKKATNADNNEVGMYQLKVDMILWNKGDGKTIIPDEIRNHSYRTLAPKPNAYFQKFYHTQFSNIKPIEGREHT